MLQAYGKAGQPAQGLAVLEEAVDCMNRTGQRLYEADLQRMKGDLLLAVSRDTQAEAEDCFRHAIDCARRQSAKSLELAAALSLSRLWRGQGKHDDARTLLAEIYGWFTEGFETRRPEGSEGAAGGAGMTRVDSRESRVESPGRM